MGEILRFQREHIPEVASLVLKVFRGRREPAGVDLEKYYDEIFFGNPWLDDDLPSRVFAQRGKVVAFMGVLPRSMLFRGRLIRVATIAQLMSDSEHSHGRTGLALVRRFLQDPQDLSLTDGATEAAYAVGMALEGQVARLYSLQWNRVLRRAAHLSWLPRVLAPVSALVDGLFSEPPRSRLVSRTATADELLDCIQAIGWREPLRPAYERDSFRWLMTQAAALRRHGRWRMVTVSAEDGAPAGWYAYYARPGGPGLAMQIGAAPRRMDEVLLSLFQDAWQEGCVSVTGQAMPRHLLNLSRQDCAFSFPGHGVLIHSVHPEIRACLLQGQAAMTRLDGEWWLRFAHEDWS